MKRAAHVWRSIRRAARIVWAERAGRTAVMAVLIGTVGLTTHHWTALPMLAVLRLPR